MSFTVNSDFMGDFKNGDNINYNLSITTSFYNYYAAATDPIAKNLLHKPIIVSLVSITEAILHDLIVFRPRNHTTEGIQGMMLSTSVYLRGLSGDMLNFYVQQAKKHDLLNDPSSQIYSDLDALRIIRNRVHIQNAKKVPPQNEVDVFTVANKDLAEKTLETIVKFCASNYSRPASVGSYVTAFSFPWAPHFP